MNKVCSKCGIEREIELFSNKSNRCKLCIKEYKRKYYIDNKDTKIKDYYNSLSDEKKDGLKKTKAKNYLKNKDRYREYYKERSDLYKKKRSDRHKFKIENNPIYRLKVSLVRRLNKSLKRNKFINSNTILFRESIGCDFDFLILYFESKFENWMNWSNYGLYNGELNYGWDIDHIIPLSVAKTEEELYKLNHYSNLQPLCGKVNRDIKRNKY